MQKLKESFLLFCFLFSLKASAQVVTIKGTAAAYTGKEIAAYSYLDLITYTPVKIGSSFVNDSGQFSLKLHDIKTSQYLYLSIGNQKGSVYVAPGNTYHVIFPAPDSTNYQNPYTTHSVDISFMALDSDNINSLIIDFNSQFDIFWRRCYKFFLNKRGPSHLDSFYLAMQNRYASVHNPYFKGYLQYTVAEYGINILEGKKTLGNKYLKNKPVLYDNYEYMNFFNDYFNDYVEQFSLTSDGADVNKYIQNNDFPGLLEVLKINPLLKGNDSLCHLVLLKGLYEMYYSGNFDKNSVKSVLNVIASQSKIEEDRLIATNMVRSFSDVTNGVASPDFALKDSQGNVTSILDFRGKYLYLCFFKSNSEQCLNELTVISALNKKYGKKMFFVCISEDTKIADMQHFLEQNKGFTWPFLFDEGGKILSKYEVKALPEFFLINPQGKFYLSPADGPSHGIELVFDRLFERKRLNNQ